MRLVLVLIIYPSTTGLITYHKRDRQVGALAWEDGKIMEKRPHCGNATRAASPGLGIVNSRSIMIRILFAISQEPESNI